MRCRTLSARTCITGESLAKCVRLHHGRRCCCHDVCLFAAFWQRVEHASGVPKLYVATGAAAAVGLLVLLNVLPTLLTCGGGSAGARARACAVRAACLTRGKFARARRRAARPWRRRSAAETWSGLSTQRTPRSRRSSPLTRRTTPTGARPGRVGVPSRTRSDARATERRVCGRDARWDGRT